jgi:hypothetical protein
MRDLAGNQRYTADIELNYQTTTRPESRLIRVILDNWAGADEDTDGDELWDGLEVRYSCLDPLVPDAEVDHDMDGLTTAEELFTTFQTDPCDPDFDDDGVLDSSDNCPFLFCEIAYGVKENKRGLTMNASFSKLVMVVAVLAGRAAPCVGEPVITTQPKSQSVSLGATVTFRVTATGTAPWTCQWRMNDLDLFDATAHSLVLTNVQLSDAGTYTVLVSDATGALISQPAELEIDPTFSKIVSSPIVEDRADSLGCAWGDIDNDDWLDLVVANGGFSSPQPCSLYHNNGDGSFTKIVNGTLPTEAVGGIGVAWADYDNDGNLDLFSSNNSPSGFLYLNDGQRNFVKSAVQPQPVPAGGAGPVWADFDNDGLIDLFVARGGQANRESYLYRNNPDHTFTAIASGDLVSVRGYARTPTWADYDNDGDLDLFIPNAVAQLTPHVLYQNNGDATFTRIDQGSALNESSDALANCWADYDNDGDLDLFVANGDRFGRSRGPMQKSFLYQNNGDGTFVKITNSVMVDDLANSMGCSWGDYDNDGFIDLFVGGLYQNNRLYRNLGGRQIRTNHNRKPGQ